MEELLNTIKKIIEDYEQYTVVTCRDISHRLGKDSIVEGLFEDAMARQTLNEISKAISREDW